MEQDNFLFLGDILTLSLMKVVPEGALQLMDSGPPSIARRDGQLCRGRTYSFRPCVILPLEDLEARIPEHFNTRAPVSIGSRRRNRECPLVVLNVQWWFYEASAALDWEKTLRKHD